MQMYFKSNVTGYRSWMEILYSKNKYIKSLNSGYIIIIILMLCLICFFAYVIRILRFNIKKYYTCAQPTPPRPIITLQYIYAQILRQIYKEKISVYLRQKKKN